ncbi:DNA/RNA non-specific endonuclease [Comamonas endophytica]|uniref:DNA/RNA non-specific endonuclease n=1 Tax=Comamonas endophytica TaxID=2949090 RepID=A0ABY6G8K5_9BURK|nr:MULTISPECIES: DNA/RNA non-specific endonuclease [unclassified Acidovorax]MCD2514250.1 DNA/RNA non-specific endonuclease [Acidovorax sp. D4N7]UYG51389.1 DNA/RNA non-specific endonuclease [Acidovorax sp. 5MLIR]
MSEYWRQCAAASLLALLAGCALRPAPQFSPDSTRFAECPQFFPAQAPPRVPPEPGQRELCYSAFAVLHSGTSKTPVFVVEHLDRATIDAARGQKRSNRFFADTRLPPPERAELTDYRGSGYSRGHMAPAGDMSTREAMKQSFSLANMVPQDQRFNGGAWAQIEQQTRQYVLRAQADVYVYTGPVFAADAPTIGAGRVQVPSHLFKLVYDPCSGRSWAHWLANAPDTTVLPTISYEELVQRTRIRFLPPAARALHAGKGCARAAAPHASAAESPTP